LYLPCNRQLLEHAYRSFARVHVVKPRAASCEPRGVRRLLGSSVPLLVFNMPHRLPSTLSFAWWHHWLARSASDMTHWFRRRSRTRTWKRTNVTEKTTRQSTCRGAPCGHVHPTGQTTSLAHRFVYRTVPSSPVCLLYPTSLNALGGTRNLVYMNRLRT